MEAAALTPNDVLAIWERGRGLSAVRRALLLLAAAAPELSEEERALLPVAERDARLLALRERTFGAELRGLANCPRCREAAEFGVGTDALRAGTAPATGGERTVDRGALSLAFRAPSSADVEAVAALADPAVARRALARRCVSGASREGVDVDRETISDDDLEAVAERIGREAALADVTLALTCPACGAEWEEWLDIPAFVFAECLAHARWLLEQVHRLAAAYGWTERETLALSAARLQFYLEAVGT
jgi:hypothetical protein